MKPGALLLSLAAVARLAAGPCTHDDYRKSLDEHCVQLLGDGQKLFSEAEQAEKAQLREQARAAFASAFKALRQAGRLALRPGATALSAPVVRLTLVKTTEASRHWEALGRQAGEGDPVLRQGLDLLKQQADTEMQERLDCIPVQ